MYGVGPYEWICDTMNLYYGIVKSLNSIKPKIIPKSVRLWTLPLIQQHTREITENPIQWNNNHPKFNSGKLSSSYLPSLSSMFFICFHPFNFYQVSNCRSPVGSASTIASVFAKNPKLWGTKIRLLQEIQQGCNSNLVGGWTNPFENYARQMGSWNPK